MLMSSACSPLVSKLKAVACSHSVEDEAPTEKLTLGSKILPCFVERSSSQKGAVSIERMLLLSHPPRGQNLLSHVLTAWQKGFA